MKSKFLLPFLLLLGSATFAQSTETSSLLGNAVSEQPSTIEGKTTSSSKSSLQEGSFDFGDYKVFPNPATSFVVLNAPDGKQKILTLNTTSGKKVKEMELNGASAILNIEPLPAGIYIMNVRETDSNKIYRTKVIKQ